LLLAERSLSLATKLTGVEVRVLAQRYARRAVATEIARDELRTR
jgi:hypothetical protein